jgi:small subunit ribosomal protein S9
MVEKKTTKKIKEEIEEVKAPVVSVAENADDEMGDDDISAEIAKSLKESGKSDRYFEAIGRRKTSVARVRFESSTKQSIIINGKDYKDYFVTQTLQNNVIAPFAIDEKLSKCTITVIVRGGGINSQSEAVRHGISRALEKSNKDLRKDLKKLGYLTRDSREKERKKYGQKKARKRFQYSKR